MGVELSLTIEFPTELQSVDCEEITTTLYPGEEVTYVCHLPGGNVKVIHNHKLWIMNPMDTKELR